LQFEDPPTRTVGGCCLAGERSCAVWYSARGRLAARTGCRCVHDPGRAAAFGRLRVAAPGAGEDAVDGSGWQRFVADVVKLFPIQSQL
jgi:hypothetical protein